MTSSGESAWVLEISEATRASLEPLRNPGRAIEMRRYMKDVSPFLGVSAPDRRHALRAGWRGMPTPSSSELGTAAVALSQMDEREYHYAAYDLIAEWIEAADETFLPAFGEELLTTVPWWDAVDGLVSAMVSPMCARFGHGELVDAWSESDDRWLIRSVLGHQRGWKNRTDIDLICKLADDHWTDPEFFVAKAIGWALRDCARLNPIRIERFVVEHLSPNPVAMREIRKGLATAHQRRAVCRP